MLRHSRQRDRILSLLQNTDIHPTADWIYAQLKPEFPHLSLGTVYRNLSILTEQGLVKKIDFGSSIDRFEAQTAPHYHLICTRCGAIRDLQSPVYKDLNDRPGRLADFEIHEHRIDFFGICLACRAITSKKKR